MFSGLVISLSISKDHSFFSFKSLPSTTVEYIVFPSTAHMQDIQRKDKRDEGSSEVQFSPHPTPTPTPSTLPSPPLILECPLAVNSIQVINIPERRLG